jgi:hypothetical protein
VFSIHGTRQVDSHHALLLCCDNTPCCLPLPLPCPSASPPYLPARQSCLCPCARSCCCTCTVMPWSASPSSQGVTRCSLRMWWRRCSCCTSHQVGGWVGRQEAGGGCGEARAQGVCCTLHLPRCCHPVAHMVRPGWAHMPRWMPLMSSHSCVTAAAAAADGVRCMPSGSSLPLGCSIPTASLTPPLPFPPPPTPPPPR